jgi:Domain of unknown function (DUF4177)
MEIPRDFQKALLPNVPQPQRPRVLQPMIYVYEKPAWEYKVISKSGEDLLCEDELNRLGADGWELVGVVSLEGGVRFYFKRART